MDRMTDLPEYQRTDVPNSRIEDENDLILVEVAYASTESQEIVQLRVPRGTVAYDAVSLSKITNIFPEVDINEADLGVFSSPLDGKRRPSSRTYVLLENDRVEIYRPLIISPMELRRQRANLRSESAKGKKNAK
jgi:putative ubiquitin-RnfH superfamily antitoxin RatB of RatAB toxin-antitoxin module|tara:strand:- start:7541 stop:7942 length:402 start_codon:yes stop_codon:yes gene_type:complete